MIATKSIFRTNASPQPFEAAGFALLSIAVPSGAAAVNVLGEFSGEIVLATIQPGATGLITAPGGVIWLQSAVPSEADITPSRAIGGLSYANTVPSTAITNSTVEALFDTQLAIGANHLQVGSKIRIRFQGIATATNSTDTLAIKLYIGGLTGTVLISIPATDVANNDVFTGEYELIVRTVGANGTMVGCGWFKSIPAAEGTMTIKDDILASTAIDTTAAQVVGVSATWSVANAGNSCRLDVLIVEIFG